MIVDCRKNKLQIVYGFATNGLEIFMRIVEYDPKTAWVRAYICNESGEMIKLRSTGEGMFYEFYNVGRIRFKLLKEYETEVKERIFFQGPAAAYTEGRDDKN